MEAAGDHEMEDEPEIVVEAESDALADATEFADGVAFGGGNGRVGGAEEEWATDADVLETLADDAGFQCGEVSGDVGEFGH